MPPKAPKRAARRDLAVLVSKTPALEVKLPLTHLSEAYHLRPIVETGELAPSGCKVFGESLVYFFYGRPAYRVASQIDNNGLDAYWPVCFVLKATAVNPKRIFPFDSGAFQDGRFADYFHRDMIKEDFELDVDPSTPGRLINLFWPDARSYFDNRPNSDQIFDPFAFEAKSYSELIRSKANAPFDDRHSAIELQSDDDVTLQDNLHAVILPEDFASVELQTRFRNLGARVLPFPTVSRHRPGEMVGQIYDICRDLYSSKPDGLGCW